MHVNQKPRRRHSEQFRALMSLAGASPDHGGLRPWRFIVVPRELRHALSKVFAQDLVDRDAAATPIQVEDAGQKVHRSPLWSLPGSVRPRRISRRSNE